MPVPPPEPPSNLSRPKMIAAASTPTATVVMQPTSTLNVPLVIFASVMGTIVLGGMLLAGILAFLHFGGYLPTPNPPAPAATDWVKLGKAYAPLLGPAYAPAWESYAADLEAGKTLPDATRNMVKTWEDQRGLIYDKLIKPELTKIAPDGIASDQVTPAQRKALADGARGLAKGLSGK